MNHLDNFANKTDTKIPYPSQISKEQAKDLNLIKKREFVCGQRVFDRAPANQEYSIFTFMPSKGATPDSDGIYGFAKIRGCYPSSEEADSAAIQFVMEFDQLSDNLIIRTGTPFPITKCVGDFVNEKDIVRVDVSSQYKSSFRNAALEKKKADEEAKKQIKIREDSLLSKPEDDDVDEESKSLEEYSTIRSKIAYQRNMIISMRENIKNLEDRIRENHKQITELDKLHPEFATEFLDMIRAEEAKSGFRKGINAELDKRVQERWDNLTNYKKDLEYLFE